METLAPVVAALGLNPVITQFVGSARAVRKVSVDKTSARLGAGFKEPPGVPVLIKQNGFGLQLIADQSHGVTWQKSVKPDMKATLRVYGFIPVSDEHKVGDDIV